ncbi:TrmH family RNA methyltransferase [Anaerorhabdus furcosa]|uniref:RNA methyltransferase, TrmH family n=1 Tax=Anaerorhabdus furcosa TaxID=118967 RepID=A0A1T4JVW5_9FIRM|nr:RNA methyltransferase [Anaerorhabdus furcosa]SJZ34298.1 RNA methyltransferase, TrmH family [Anaerorhabdus furcosa]
MSIQSVQNERVKQWVKLHGKKGRDESLQFLVEGEHLIKEALKVNCVDLLLIEEGINNPFDFSVVEECSINVMNKVSQNVSGAKYIAVCHYIEHHIVDATRVLLLDNVQDPGNMGTIIRTAYSFNIDGIYCSNDCVDVYNDKTIRSTQGAIFHLPVIRCDLNQICNELKGEGYQLFGTALENAIPFSEAKDFDKVALVFGNEGQGIRKDLLGLMDQNFKIEINEFDSLNVAIAAGICMYRYRK